MSAAIWLTGHDTRLRSTATTVRSLRTYAMIPTAALLARADETRGRFSPAKWRAFCDDIAWLKIQPPAPRWVNGVRIRLQELP